jgi:hypothetical protein
MKKAITNQYPITIISALLIDKDNNLWVMSALGDIGIFDKKKIHL